MKAFGLWPIIGKANALNPIHFPFQTIFSSTTAKPILLLKYFTTLDLFIGKQPQHGI